MANKLKKKGGGPIACSKFSLEESKMYVVATLICFHILPLLFVFWGETGQNILVSVFMLVLNPLLIFSVCCFHACRLGFCFKFPALSGALAALSILMYYDGIAPEMKLVSTFIALIVYLIIAFASELMGGFFKKMIGG